MFHAVLPLRHFLAASRAVLASCVLFAGASGCFVDEGFAALSTDLTVAPVAVELDPLFGGSPVLLSLTVKNDGGAPARLTAADVRDNVGVDVLVAVSPLADAVPAHGALDVRLTVTAPAFAEGVFGATIALTFDDTIELTVPVVAFVRPIPVCDDNNPCTDDSFDGVACQNVVSVDGTPCDDDNACTTATQCLDGQCKGEIVACTDGQDCTVDVCDPTRGCVYEPLAERCNDDDPCTDDVCASDVGCTNPAKDPGALCHFGGCDQIGICMNGLCEMHDVPDGFVCDDGDACTVDDRCQAGVCAPGVPADPGPEDPLVLVDGTVPALLCAGPGIGCVNHALLPQEILAAHRRVDGNVQAVWRTDYVWSNSGLMCDPSLPMLLGSASRKDPASAGACECMVDDECASGVCDLSSPSCGFCVDTDDGTGDQPPPPMLPPTCQAAVFLTRTTTNALVTTQLTTAAGPVAASLVDTAAESAQVAVARANDIGSVVVDLFSGVGAPVRTQVLARDTTLPATSWSVAQLAVVHSPTRLSVIALPEWRDVIALKLGCADDGLCLGVPVEVWNVQALSSGDIDFDVTQSPLVVTLEEWADPRCAVAIGGGRPLLVEDLSIAISDIDDTTTDVALRMDPFACGDFASNVVLSVPRVYRFSTANFETSLFANVGPLDQNGPPWIMEVAQIDGTTASSSTTSAGIVTVDNCDPSINSPSPDSVEDCICLDCEGCPCDCAGAPVDPDPVDTCLATSVVRFTTVGAVSIADVLLSNLNADAAEISEAHTVVVNGEKFTVARIGDVLSFLGREQDGTLIYKPAPVLAGDGHWRAGLTAGTSIVAGLVDNHENFDTLPAVEDPVPINPLIQSTQIVSQGFACGADAEPLTCSTTSDCPSDLVCDDSACGCNGDVACPQECVGVCVAPSPAPTEDAGVNDAGPDVEGLCLDDTMCADDAMCIFGETCLFDSLCDADAPNGCECYGTCVPHSVPPDDAGILDDGGVSDAGALDDAGAPVDAGALDDAGLLNDGGASFDAGL